MTSIIHSPLNRRTFLRAVGAAVALPLLDAMVPAYGKTPVIPKRMVAIHVPLGWMPKFFFPQQDTGGVPTSPYLDLLSDQRGRFTTFSGLSHPDVGSNHAAGQCFLTGAPGPGLPTFRNSQSLDQFAAERIGLETRFPSLALAVLKDKTHSIPSAHTLSVSRDGVFVPPEMSPQRLYRDMFVAGTPEEQAQTLRNIKAGGSVLDTLRESAGKLDREVGPADRHRMDQYFTSIRELEKRLEQSIVWSKTPKPIVSEPEPRDIEDVTQVFERAQLMFDMLKLALQTDSTRVVSMLLGTAVVAHVPGVTRETHGLTHHGNEPEKIAELRKVEEAQTRALASLLTSLHEQKEADGSTLLDNTQVLIGSCLGNANSHSNQNLPIILAGGGYKHPGHLAFDSKHNEPLSNLYVTMLQRLGIETDSFASSTGTLRGLELS